MRLRYNAVNFSVIPIKDPQYLARYGEVWGAFCGFKLSSIFCHSHRSDVCNIVLYWAAL